MRPWLTSGCDILEPVTNVERLTRDVLARTSGDIDTLRRVVDALDHQLSAGPLERAARLWDVSVADLGRMFGVSRQAAAKWLADGPPAARRDDVALLDDITGLLDRWVKRERIPAVVRRPVDVLDGRSRLDLALAGELERLRDELRETFDVTRVAP